MCEISCYKEPDCVSYNYGPKKREKPWCDLNNGTHLQVSAEDFVTKEGYTYRDVLVRVRTLNQSINSPTIVGSITQTNLSLRIKGAYNSVKDSGLSIAMYNNIFKNYHL